MLIRCYFTHISQTGHYPPRKWKFILGISSFRFAILSPRQKVSLMSNL